MPPLSKGDLDSKRELHTTKEVWREALTDMAECKDVICEKHKKQGYPRYDCINCHEGDDQFNK